MSLGQLRRYDVQANYAFALSLCSIIPLAGAVVLTLRNYDGQLGRIIYGAAGYYLPVFAACLLLSMLPGALGFALGLSSAGQRRNDKPTRSWIGFFLGGTVLTFDLILAIAFLMLRLKTM